MYHPDNFFDREEEPKQSTQFPCLMICMMQFAATLLTELACIYLIYSSKDAKEALMNFVALAVIC